MNQLKLVPVKVPQEETLEKVVVEVGDLVTFSEQGINVVEKYRIVEPRDASADDGFISRESIVGKALLGRQVGDLVGIKAPGGVYVVEILDIGKGNDPRIRSQRKSGVSSFATNTTSTLRCITTKKYH